MQLNEHQIIHFVEHPEGQLAVLHDARSGAEISIPLDTWARLHWAMGYFIKQFTGDAPTMADGEYVAIGGKRITADELDRLVAEAERGYDPEQMTTVTRCNAAHPLPGGGVCTADYGHRGRHFNRAGLSWAQYAEDQACLPD